MKTRLKAPEIRRITLIFVISAPELTKITHPRKFHLFFTTPPSTAWTMMFPKGTMGRNGLNYQAYQNPFLVVHWLLAHCLSPFCNWCQFLCHLMLHLLNDQTITVLLQHKIPQKINSRHCFVKSSQNSTPSEPPCNNALKKPSS